MDPDVITALIAAGASFVTGIGSYLAGRRQSREERKQLETEQSGERKIAELEDAREFRRDILAELDKVRDDNRQMRAELARHGEECERKIREAVLQESIECDQKITSKLRAQAAQLRAEFARKLDERTDPE